MTRWKSSKVGSARIQSGIPMRAVNPRYEQANGLLFRGVVTATYVIDDPEHPSLTLDPNVPPVAVYCDVLVYSSMANQRFSMLKQVLVSQEVGAMHHGRIYKPKATTVDIASQTLDPDHASNPANMDGDHVLVGFIDGSTNTPVILRGIPHPSRDVGNTGKEIGNRMQLKVADGDPDFWKHHGSYYGIEDNGDYTVDTTFANSGEVDAGGVEPAPPTDGSGSQRFWLEQNAEHEVTLWDMGTPSSPSEVAKITLDKDKWRLSFGQGETLKLEDKDGNATLTLGDGAVHAAIFESLETFWNMTIKPKFDAFDRHVHANPSTYVFPLIPLPGLPVSVVPVTVPPLPPFVCPTLATNIKSNKTKIPNG